MEDFNPAILILEDGTIFHGKACGKKGTTSGEIAFNTGMTGYQEVFSDPSYFGQILIMNAAHIGNYGVQENESESSKIQIAGLVCKNFSETYSRTSANLSLEEWMSKENCVGISDIDTRALVRVIRNKGVMNAIISSEIFDLKILKEKLKLVPPMSGRELSSFVTSKKSYEIIPNKAEFKVAVLDFGIKKSILDCLIERSCHLKVFPFNSMFKEILDFNPDGIMLSNGPGDPDSMKESIELVKKLTETTIPIFGICLGHQILALSQGLKTEKMFNGHRGINHPIMNIKTGKGEITSQNHGFVVSKESINNNSNIIVTHTHLNDNTIAGIEIKDKAVFSVQYHPEASAGPHDSRYLFDQFIENIVKNKEKTENKIKI
ncbi:MAG: glutamine-hydrolyzing carbamoyl-phosphate synthase small subunit [Flavobacteriia bacterium]|nr:glutamine-hydrolyzing carbamoyl-phosphate synthase small subunit [Flavobacteriia bacterium]